MWREGRGGISGRIGFVNRRTFASVFAAAALLAACAHQSPAPSGWQPQPGASAAWSSGAQRYAYAQRAFSGTLQDLASQEAVNVVLQHHGAKFSRSDVFAPCPGRAAMATFALPGGDVLEDAFAVTNGKALVVTYVRPAGTAIDPAVEDAMQRALCSTAI